MGWLLDLIDWAWSLLSWRHDRQERDLGARAQENADLQITNKQAHDAQRIADEIARLPDSVLDARLRDGLRKPPTDN